MTRPTARILPVPLNPPIKRETLRSGGLLILAAGFDLPNHEKPRPRATEAGAEGFPDDFFDDDWDGQHV